MRTFIGKKKDRYIIASVFRLIILAPIIMPGDVIALKKLATWKTYIPGDFICVVVTSEYKVLHKVSVTQPDEQSINFTQMVDGTPVEASIPKDIIVEIYKVVGNYRRQ